MRTISRISIVLSLLSAASCRPAESPRDDTDWITQVSVIDALMIGQYDGTLAIADLLRLGDFGLGTLDHLDGELIVLDGRAYQVRADGAVAEVAPDRSTPFAVVTPFEGDGAIPCPRAASLADLDARLDDALPQTNRFFALRLEGRFDSITLRSVRRQEPPYRPLAEVAEEQSVWTIEDLAGTMVGIRCPPWVGGLNVPGYHWHFLSDDRTIGGHVLDCRTRDGRFRYDLCRDWRLILPGTDAFATADLTGDLSDDLERVESARGLGEAGGEETPAADRDDRPSRSAPGTS